MNIYIVKSYAGSCDSAHEWISGIYSSLEDAEKRKQEIDAEYQLVKDNCPVEEDYDVFNDEQENKYYSYWFSEKNHKWYEFRECLVKEYPLNQRIDKNE